MILTTRSLYFQHAKSSETGLISFYISFYKLISTIFKCQYSRLKPKVIHYRNCKNFNEASFLKDLNPNKSYSHVSETCFFKKGNFEAYWFSFYQKNIRKEKCTRSRLRHLYWKTPSLGYKRLYKKQENKCVSLQKKTCIKEYFQKIPKRALSQTKTFWDFDKPFLTKLFSKWRCPY